MHVYPGTNTANHKLINLGELSAYEFYMFSWQLAKVLSLIPRKLYHYMHSGIPRIVDTQGGLLKATGRPGPYLEARSTNCSK